MRESLLGLPCSSTLRLHRTRSRTSHLFLPRPFEHWVSGSAVCVSEGGRTDPGGSPWGPSVLLCLLRTPSFIGHREDPPAFVCRGPRTYACVRVRVSVLTSPLLSLHTLSTGRLSRPPYENPLRPGPWITRNLSRSEDSNIFLRGCPWWVWNLPQCL